MKKNFFRWALISLALLAISFAPTPEEEKPTVRIGFYEDLMTYIMARVPFLVDITFTNTKRLLIWPDNEYAPREINIPIEHKSQPEEHTVSIYETIEEYDTYRSYQVIAENKYGDRDYAYMSFMTSLPPLGAE